MFLMPIKDDEKHSRDIRETTSSDESMSLSIKGTKSDQMSP